MKPIRCKDEEVEDIFLQVFLSRGKRIVSQCVACSAITKCLASFNAAGILYVFLFYKFNFEIDYMCRVHSNVIPFLIGKNLWLKCRVKSLEHPRLACRTDDTFVLVFDDKRHHISPAPERTHCTRALCTGTWRRILFGCNWISSMRCDEVFCDTLCIWQFGQCHRHTHTIRRTLIALSLHPSHVSCSLRCEIWQPIHLYQLLVVVDTFENSLTHF